MKVLVIGSGGREHALAWKLSQSKQVSEIFVAPGNPGIENIATCVSIAVDDLENLVNFARSNQIDLTVVGPEKPLTLGIVDIFKEAGLRCFGPSKLAAEIEGSKAFSKDLMKKYGIPTAEYGVFTDNQEANMFIESMSMPCVVKADGLAAGKGVIICENQKQAFDAVEEMLENNVFGEAGHRVVIESYLTGQEVSILAFADGDHIIPMVSAQDHKRIFDNDQGANTGGMGAYSPAPIYTEEIAQMVMKDIIKPTIDAMKAEGRPFTGILYTGLMLTPEGPKVLEYNARFGDPETQPVLMRMESDLYEVFNAAIDGRLNEIDVNWKDDAAVCVVLASKGYPETSSNGDVILGADRQSLKDVCIFHAGTKIEESNLVTNGGRVLGVTACGNSIKDAIDKAYEAVDAISFEGMQFRKDIGAKALKMEA